MHIVWQYFHGFALCIARKQVNSFYLQALQKKQKPISLADAASNG